MLMKAMTCLTGLIPFVAVSFAETATGKETARNLRNAVENANYPRNAVLAAPGRQAMPV